MTRTATETKSPVDAASSHLIGDPAIASRHTHNHRLEELALISLKKQEDIAEFLSGDQPSVFENLLIQDNARKTRPSA